MAVMREIFIVLRGVNVNNIYIYLTSEIIID